MTKTLTQVFFLGGWGDPQLHGFARISSLKNRKYTFVDKVLASIGESVNPEQVWVKLVRCDYNSSGHMDRSSGHVGHSK